jgi:elongation factor 1-alpha
MALKVKKNSTFVDLTENPKLILHQINPCIPEHCYVKKDEVIITDLDTGLPVEKLFPQEVRIATIGNVDAGKSTTVGVIKSQEPDDGNGRSRKGVFRHQHEIDSGRTSDVGSQYMQYKNRLYSVSDLAGHEGYLRTTIYGLVSVPIDWNMLVVSANQGIEKMTREHLAITFSLNLNMFVVFTKSDMAPVNVFEENMKNLFRFVKKIKRTPIIIKNTKDLQTYYDDITMVNEEGNKVKGVMNMTLSNKFVPIFVVSNVTMKNMDLLQTFIFNLRPNVDWSKEERNKKKIFVIDKTYSPKGVGLVVSGIVKHGTFDVNKTYMLGPFGSLDKAVFYPVTIRNIRDNTEIDIPEVNAGFSACFNITAKDKDMVTRATIRKGMILTEVPTSTRKFKAKITILHHPTKISVGYEPHLHCGGVKETMKITQMDEEYIQAGRSTNAILEFKTRRGYVEENDQFIFREGNTRGSGKVLEILD